VTFSILTKYISGQRCGHCQGCQGQVNQKCQATCKKMPDRFKKCQTSWKRPNAVGFDITRWIMAKTQWCSWIRL